MTLTHCTRLRLSRLVIDDVMDGCQKMKRQFSSFLLLPFFFFSKQIHSVLTPNCDGNFFWQQWKKIRNVISQNTFLIENACPYYNLVDMCFSEFMKEWRETDFGRLMGEKLLGFKYEEGE